MNVAILILEMRILLLVIFLASSETTSSSLWSLPHFENASVDFLLDRTNDSVAVKALVGTDAIESNPEKNIYFTLYTRKNPHGIDLQINDKNKLLNFDFNRDTKILIHGFSNSAESNFNQVIKKAYIKQATSNVIMVDWGDLCRAPFYHSAVENMQIVGVHTAQLIKWLVAEGLSLAKVHILGHSIGAHIAGITAQNLTDIGTIHRITGLDPAKPTFESSTKDERLSADDAHFVDCIHTCGGFLGMSKPVCSVDFYPNGGTSPQPGCKYDIFGVCSHQRAYRFFAESIEEPNSFRTVRCSAVENYSPVNCTNNSIVTMGEHTNPRTRGVFYLTTSAAPPFSLQTSFDISTFTQFTWYFR